MTQTLGYKSLHTLIGADDLEWADSNGWSCMLLDNTYVFSDAHDFVADVVGDEVAGTGYTAGGQVLTGLSKAWDGDWYKYTCDSPEWAASTITARYAVFYKDTGSDATSPLLLVIDQEADVASAASLFSVPIDADGLFRTGFTP